MNKQPCNVDVIANNIKNSLKSLHHQLKQKEDKIEQLQKHVLWLETEMNDAKYQVSIYFPNLLQGLHYE